MKGQAGKAKWIGMLLLQIPLYMVTSYFMRRMVGIGYGLLVKAGANLSPNLLLRHFLLVSLFDGFLAGLAGVFLFRAMLLLPKRVQVTSKPVWQRPQAWTWVISTCWLAFGIFNWAASNSSPSVLGFAPSLGFSDVVTVFLVRGCDLLAASLNRSVMDRCETQILYTFPWLGTVGYSVAAFIPTGWTNRNALDSADLEAPAEEQNEKQQSRLRHG